MYAKEDFVPAPSACMTIACVGSRLMKSGTTLQKARGKRPLSMFLGMRGRAVTRAAPSHMSQFSLIHNFYSKYVSLWQLSTKSLDGCMHIALVCGYSPLFVAFGITIHLCSGRQWGTWFWCHSWGHGPEHDIMEPGSKDVSDHSSLHRHSFTSQQFDP